jgi:hypothetical protein
MKLSEIRQSDGKLPAYAWPGGYPIVYMARDNGILCPRCANEYELERDNSEQLEPVAYFVNPVNLVSMLPVSHPALLPPAPMEVL